MRSLCNRRLKPARRLIEASRAGKVTAGFSVCVFVDEVVFIIMSYFICLYHKPSFWKFN